MTLTTEQYKERLSGIGASEIADILGIGYHSPYDVWLVKTEQAEPEDLSDNDAVVFGTLLEDVVAREYARRNNCRVQRVQGMVRSKEFPWLFCSPDRRRVGSRINVQIKTANMFARGWGEDNTDAVPDAYNAQVQQEMLITALDETHIPVLVAGQKYKQYVVKPNYKIRQIIIDESRKFWQHVETRTPPPPITMDDARKRYAQCYGTEIYADSGIKAVIAELNAANQWLKHYNTLADAAKTAVMDYMGHNEILMGNGKPLATWKAQTKKCFDSTRFKADQAELYAQYVTESTHRTLLIKK